jgi:hypothetical protein
MGESAGQSQNGTSLRTDPTFYRSAAEAVAAPSEKLAYVVAFDRSGERHDALAGRTCRPVGTSCTTSAGTPAPAH